MTASIESALEELRKGKMVVVMDDERRENEGDLVMAAEFADKNAVNFMMKEGRGLICVPLEESIVHRLDLKPMEQKNVLRHGCHFLESVDVHHETSTGISAADRSKTIQALAHADSKAEDFARPGHIFPLAAKKGGVLVRAGHTEAGVDLMSLAGLKPAAVICEIVKDDGEMARLPDLHEFAQKHELLIITIKDLIEYRRTHECLVKKEAETLLQTEFGEFRILVFKNRVDDRENILLVKGNPENKENVLVRAHSECLTGEVFHSLHCDCRNQLEMAMHLIEHEGEGVILYMRQEGRGIGLTNKIKAYELQRQGLDTVEANRELGFDDDLREYGIGAQMLKSLGLSRIRLLTNNPRKIVGLEGYGLEVVERIPLETALAHDRERRYMSTKKEKMGHILKNV